MFKRFLANTRGNVAIIFALVSVPAMAIAGAAIDYTNASQEYSRLQVATDSASLAGAKQVGLLSEEGVRQAVTDVFDANYRGPKRERVTLSIVVGDSDVNVVAASHTDTSFMKLMHFDEIALKVSSTAIVGRDKKIDVVLVLDNSGSMSGSKIDALRSAAADLTQILMNANKTAPSGEEPVQVGVVPFTAFVNVGSQYKTASWMDTNGQSPIHSEDFNQTANRFDLFNELSGVSWRGCVTSRPYPHDVTDTLPTSGNPQTLFVPHFAPDEPGSSNSNGHSFKNNYISDWTSTCTTPLPNDSTRWEAAQSRICKYTGANYSSGSGVSKGPNYGCRTNPLTPMTIDQTIVETAVNNLTANGYTNIHQGVMWGWRVLSPEAPFTEGRSDVDDKVEQFLIVMTDGKNTYITENSPNDTVSFAYGYTAKGRLGTVGNYSAILSKMNERTQESCTNTKTVGEVKIYTIAFQVSDTATLELLENCATEPSMAFRSETNGDLIEAFRKIAQEINSLRISM